MLADIDMRRRIVSKGAAIAVGGFGLYIIGEIWWGFLGGLEFESYFDFIFLLIFPIPMTLLGGYLLFQAIKIWSVMSYKNVCSLSSVSSIIMVMLLLGFSELFEPSSVESARSVVWFPLELLTLMVLAGVFYVAVKGFLLKWLCVDEELNYFAHKSAVKRYFGFLAFFLWLPLSETAQLLPRDPVYTHRAANHHLEMLIMFGSIPAAYIIYRIGVKLFLKKRPEPVGEIEKLMMEMGD